MPAAGEETSRAQGIEVDKVDPQDICDLCLLEMQRELLLQNSVGNI